MKHQLLRSLVLIVTVAGCAPLPETQYWQGFFLHLHPPRYRFRVPDGWRQATVSDYPSFGFNRPIFATLDEEGRRAFLQRAEPEMRGRDAVLISTRGGWIQVQSELGAGASRNWLRYGLSEREKQTIWRRFSSGLVKAAPEADKPTLSLESMSVEDYGLNRVLRLRFRSDVTRGSLYWTILVFYTSADAVTFAHLGIPDDRDEGIEGLEVIALSFRFD